MIDYFLPRAAGRSRWRSWMAGQGPRKYASTDKPEATWRKLAEAVDSAVLAAHAATLPSHTGNASLGLGSALHHADGDQL
jgi:hypothetical protein